MLIMPPSIQFVDVLREEVRKFTFRTRQLGLEVKAIQFEAVNGAFEVKFKSPSPFRPEQNSEEEEAAEEAEDRQMELPGMDD